jgi:8-oxo-dGTP pyrophosphatase MutT (NUDIX family)
MGDEQLKWEILETKRLLHTPVFDILEQTERAAGGLIGSYVAMQAPDWVMTIPVYKGCFVTVRQWRHSSECLSTEFPGGVADPNEDPAVTAVRELKEETGFEVGKLTHLGTVNPNPALFKNRFHVYLAEELLPTGRQHLDADELLRYELTPIDEVLENFGSPEYCHALMGTALALYLRRIQKPSP